jgi:hypothetical protein
MRSTALDPTSSLGFVNAGPRALATAAGQIDDLLKAAPERMPGQRGAARIRLCEADVALV